MSGLSRFAGDMLTAEIILRGKAGTPHLFSISARLALPGRDIHGNAVHHNLYTAIDQLVAKLARLARKRKTRLAKKFKRARRDAAVDSEDQSRIRNLSALVKRGRIAKGKSHQTSVATSRAHRKRGGQEMPVFPLRRRLPV